VLLWENKVAPNAWNRYQFDVNIRSCSPSDKSVLRGAQNDNASARETCSAEQAHKCGSGDKVYVEGKLMEMSFEIDRWG
jgi:hypothetical protein